MSKTITIIIALLVVVFFIVVIFYHPDKQKYDITITEGNQQRVQNCDMPPGWKIITDGEDFSYETETGYRTIFTYSSPLEACEKANNAFGRFKRDWKYLK